MGKLQRYLVPKLDKQMNFQTRSASKLVATHLCNILGVEQFSALPSRNISS